MKINNAGLELIKSFEGCRLKAYRCPAGVLTIGWGHTGGVKEGQVITQAQADEYLKKDLVKFEKAVDDLGQCFNENQFSALVSFAYNCGPQNLNKLCIGRNPSEISEKILLYNKANGKTLAGLERRRKAEKKLFDTTPEQTECVFPEAELSLGDEGSDVVWLQRALNKNGSHLVEDGIFGNKTLKALKSYQTKKFVTGKLDDNTKSALLR